MGSYIMGLSTQDSHHCLRCDAKNCVEVNMLTRPRPAKKTLKATGLRNFHQSIYISFYPKTAEGKQNIENWLCFKEVICLEEMVSIIAQCGRVDFYEGRYFFLRAFEANPNTFCAFKSAFYT